MPLKLTTYYEEKCIPELPGSDFFHSKELFHIYEATSRYRPILIVASENEKPVAKLLAVVRKNKRIHIPSFFYRCDIFGAGEYLDKEVNREEIFSEMLEHLTADALRRSMLIEFRNLSNPLFGYKSFRENHYFPVNWLRVRHSLHSMKNPMDRFSESRKKEIKKGLENGAVIGEAQTKEEITAFTKMLRKYYSAKIRRHFPDEEYFHYLLQQNKEKPIGKIFTIKYRNKIIGGSVCVFSCDNAWLLFSGGMKKIYAKLFPGVLAVWAAINYSRENGYRHLEFTDVGLPFTKHGYREFVLRFGGQQSSTRRWFRLKWDLLNKILEKVYV